VVDLENCGSLGAHRKPTKLFSWANVSFTWNKYCFYTSFVLCGNMKTIHCKMTTHPNVHKVTKYSNSNV
jgi:hypothetical protein